MARYIGPKTKIARKFGEPIYGADRYFEKKNYPPGQHGLAKKRKKTSEYGVLERQFRNTYAKAQKMKGRTGENLIILLESRLDNIVYRMGIAPTRAAARQLVSHCHIIVDGEVCNIPSTLLRPGQVIGVRERSKSLEVIQNVVADTCRYSWIEWNRGELSGKFLNLPERTEIPETINEQLIVELYSK